MIEGSGLKINSVSVEDGEATITGLVDSCVYTRSARSSFWGKLSK